MTFYCYRIKGAKKTDKCHPVFKFPLDWNITHSENHWANTATQMDYVKNIILPYIKKVRRTQNLSKSQMVWFMVFNFTYFFADSTKLYILFWRMDTMSKKVQEIMVHFVISYHK
jgi:hypothetical protein